MAPDWPTIKSRLKQAGLDIADTPPRPVAGGDISPAWRLDTATGAVFLKTGPAAVAERFAAEAAGLQALAATGTVVVPEVLFHDTAGVSAVLALAWLDLRRADANSDRLLGEQLADLHRHTATTFGWTRDNWLGDTPQSNQQTVDWSTFYVEQRLVPQLALAARCGFDGALQRDGQRLLKALPTLLADHRPAPSLLHGDLWSGNRADVDGRPVIFDPAVYYGDRETDLAMTRLFGGFGADFYAAYEARWPLPPGHEQRDALYRLYHVLNHLNLFGSSYLDQSLTLIRRVLAS